MFDMLGGVGVGDGGVEGLLGRMGVGGERWVRYQYTLKFEIFIAQC